MRYVLAWLALFWCAMAMGQTKITISLDHGDALYTCGETAVFKVSVMGDEGPHKEGTASVRLSNDGLTTLATRQVDLAAENPFTVEGTLEKPGILSLDVEVKAQPKTLHAVYGAAFQPLEIRPGAPEPADFMDFWTTEIQKAQALPQEPELVLSQRLTNDKVDCYKISFAAPEGQRIYGFLTVPKAEGRYPAIVNVPGAGPGVVNGLMMEDFVGLVMNVHIYDPDIPGKTIKESYQDLVKGGAYMFKGIPDREKTYFHHGIIGINRALNWLANHPKVDATRMGYFGTSQGGAFGFILSGLNPDRFAAILCNVPALCDHLGFREGRQAGWPQFCSRNKAISQIEDMVPYYDAANFAGHIGKDVVVHVIVGLADRTCCPSSVYAAYNRIPARDKQILNEIGMGHEVRPAYRKDISWLKEFLRKKPEGGAPKPAGD